jgi:hypothetical protein
LSIEFILKGTATAPAGDLTKRTADESAGKIGTGFRGFFETEAIAPRMSIR